MLSQLLLCFLLRLFAISFPAPPPVCDQKDTPALPGTTAALGTYLQSRQTQLCYSGYLSLQQTTPLVTLFIQDCYPCSSHTLLQHPQCLMSLSCPPSLEETSHDSIPSFWPFPHIQIMHGSIHTFFLQLQNCSYSVPSFPKYKLSAICSAILLLPFSSPLSTFSVTITLHASKCPGN